MKNLLGAGALTLALLIATPAWSQSATATAANPSYTEGATSALSLDLSGNLRVRDDILTQNFGGTTDLPYGGSGAGTLMSLQKSIDGSLRTLVTNSQSTNPIPTTVSGSVLLSNSDFGADCTVVSGEQAYTAGQTQRCTMTGTGRVKVDLASAATIGGTASTTSDLQGAKDPSGNQQPNNQDSNGNLQVANRGSIFWNGGTGAGSALAASATYTDTSARDSGYAVASYHQFGYFSAFFLTDQAGTASIECSNNNSVFYTCASAPLTAATPLTLQVPVLARYHRAKVVNGATAETYLWVNSGYTGS